MDVFRGLISHGEVDQAIEGLSLLLEDKAYENDRDTIFYLRGNAYRKKGDWKRALDNYQYAIDLNPDTPASEAKAMVMEILNFYNKDMYNH